MSTEVTDTLKRMMGDIRGIMTDMDEDTLNIAFSVYADLMRKREKEAKEKADPFKLKEISWE